MLTVSLKVIKTFTNKCYIKLVINFPAKLERKGILFETNVDIHVSKPEQK